MTLTVSLRDLVGELQIVPNECRAYLNRITGEVVIEGMDNDLPWLDDELSPDPESDQAPQPPASGVHQTSDLLLLPSHFDIDDYHIMEGFCASLPNERLSERLMDDIQGSSAFRRFRHAIRRYELEDAWYAYKDQAYRRILVEWLQENDIPYTDDFAA